MQRLRRLLRNGSVRQAEGAFAIEGAKLLTEALDAGLPVESVYLDGDADRRPNLAPLVTRALDAGARVYRLDRGVLARVADTTTPQPVVAVLPTVDHPLDALRDSTLSLVLVDVRDPGNAGTALRSAEAAGADGVVCTHGSVDVYNPKTVRASAGSLFHVKVVAGGEPLNVLERMGAWGMQRMAAVARHGSPYTTVDLTRRSCFVLGNESSGLDDAIVDACDDRVTIPMAGRSESLNVGMAAAVLCFEAARQRAEPGRG